VEIEIVISRHSAGGPVTAYCQPAEAVLANRSLLKVALCPLQARLCDKGDVNPDRWSHEIYDGWGVEASKTENVESSLK